LRTAPTPNAIPTLKEKSRSKKSATCKMREREGESDEKIGDKEKVH